MLNNIEKKKVDRYMINIMCTSYLYNNIEYDTIINYCDHSDCNYNVFCVSEET